MAMAESRDYQGVRDQPRIRLDAQRLQIVVRGGNYRLGGDREASDFDHERPSGEDDPKVDVVSLEAHHHDRPERVEGGQYRHRVEENPPLVDGRVSPWLRAALRQLIEPPHFVQVWTYPPTAFRSRNSTAAPTSVIAKRVMPPQRPLLSGNPGRTRRAACRGRGLSCRPATRPSLVTQPV